MRPKFFPLTLIATVVLALAACTTAAQPNQPGNPPSGGVEAGIVKGTVLDAQGKPLAGVEVVANNTQFHDANILGKTDSQGRYRLQLTAGSWQMTASFVREYNGQTYRVELTPDSDAAFAGTQGAVRNFTWKTSGGEARQGSVFVYSDIGVELLDYAYIELTLVPQGPLLDGSTGKTITGKLKATADGDGLTNVPVGRYKVSARYLKPGEEGPLELKPRRAADDTYAAALTADFEPRYGSGLDIFWIELMTRKGAQ